MVSEEDIKILEKMINEIIEKDDCNLFETLSPLETALKIKKMLQGYKELEDENKEIKSKNRAIKQESNAYAESMIRLSEEVKTEKEKSKYEWIRQNCLPMELVNKLYIPKSLVEEKIEEIDKMIEKINKGELQRYTVGGLLSFKRTLKELLKGDK